MNRHTDKQPNIQPSSLGTCKQVIYDGRPELLPIEYDHPVFWSDLWSKSNTVPIKGDNPFMPDD